MFVLTFDNTENDANKFKRDSQRKYFLPRVNITIYNMSINGRNFYDQSINDEVKQYDKIREIAIGKRNDYTTGCLIGFKFFKNCYRLICCDLLRQKELNADPRVIQQIEFYGKLETHSQLCTVLEKSKETVLKFCKVTAKIL